MLDKVQIGLLVIQIVILIFQIGLTKKEFTAKMKSDKGYFEIEETNTGTQKPKFLNRFYLEEDSAIGFYVKGSSDLFLESTTIYVNNVEQTNAHSSHEMFFSLNKRFGKYQYLPRLEEDIKENDHIDFLFVFNLKNMSEFKYTEIVKIRFNKYYTFSDGKIEWEINTYNMKISYSRFRRLKHLGKKIRNFTKKYFHD